MAGRNYLGAGDSSDYTDNFDVRASLRHIAQAARCYRRTVLFTIFATLVLTTLYVWLWQPIYKSSAILMAEGLSDFNRDAFYSGWAVFRKDDPRAEVELMQSAPILEEVVRREKLTYDDIYHPFMSHASHLWGKSLIGRGYRKVKYMIFKPEPGGLTPEQLEMAKILADMKAGISVEPVGDTNVGKLTVKGPSRKVAAIANTLMAVYLEKRVERYADEAEESLQALSNEVNTSAIEVREIEARRLAFTTEHNLTFDFQKEGIEVQKLADIEGDIATATTRIAVMQASLAEVERQLAVEPANKTLSDVTQTNPLKDNLRQKRLDLQTTLELTRQRYRSDSPEVKEMEADLGRLDTLLAEQEEKLVRASTTGVSGVHQELISKRNGLRSELDGARAGVAVLQQTANRLRSRLYAVPALSMKLKDLDRDLGTASEKYQALRGKRAQAAVALAAARTTTPSLRIVEPAAIPNDLWWPKKKLLFPGAAILGFFLGLFIAVVRTYTDGLVRREHLDGGRREMELYGSIAVITDGRPLIIAAPKGNRAALKAGAD